MRNQTETSNEYIVPGDQSILQTSLTTHGEPPTNAAGIIKSTNETEVSTTPVELEPYVHVVKPARPALTYERVE